MRIGDVGREVVILRDREKASLLQKLPSIMTRSLIARSHAKFACKTNPVKLLARDDSGTLNISLEKTREISVDCATLSSHQHDLCLLFLAFQLNSVIILSSAPHVYPISSLTAALPDPPV
jgi:hypothetical protein